MMNEGIDPRKIGHSIDDLDDLALMVYRQEWGIEPCDLIELVYQFGLPREPRLEPVQAKLKVLGCTGLFVYEHVYGYWWGEARREIRTLEEGQAINTAIKALLSEANALFSKRMMASSAERAWYKRMWERD